MICFVDVKDKLKNKYIFGHEQIKNGISDSSFFNKEKSVLRIIEISDVKIIDDSRGVEVFVEQMIGKHKGQKGKLWCKVNKADEFRLEVYNDFTVAVVKLWGENTNGYSTNGRNG